MDDIRGGHAYTPSVVMKKLHSPDVSMMFLSLELCVLKEVKFTETPKLPASYCVGEIIGVHF